MQKSQMIKIVQLCREIDETAVIIYKEISELCNDNRLSAFWQKMSVAEADHVSFWERAEKSEAVFSMPSLFEQPENVISELRSALTKSRELLKNCKQDFSQSKAFIIAYRMEFYLLHPAFEMLFHLLGPTAGGPNPEDDYESHIEQFIIMLNEYGGISPELELLGETLQRLWKENKHLAIQSTHDDLTGVLNRRGFFSLSVQFAHLAQRTDSTIGVMMLDLDHFKAVNDELGHQSGDLVLKGTAELLEDQLRASDIIGRYGGEEFIVFLSDTRRGATGKLAEKLRHGIETNPPNGIPVTVSIGFVEGKLGHKVLEDFQQLIQKADDALYAAKRFGRNRAVEYNPDSNTSK